MNPDPYGDHWYHTYRHGKACKTCPNRQQVAVTPVGEKWQPQTASRQQWYCKIDTVDQCPEVQKQMEEV